MRNNTSNNNNTRIEVGVDFQLPAKLVAAVASCDIETVKAARKGTRVTGPKASKAAKADVLLQQGMSNLIAEVKRVVNI